MDRHVARGRQGEVLRGDGRKTWRKAPLGRPKHRWEDDIKI
jgi:hypothetical protein